MQYAFAQTAFERLIYLFVAYSFVVFVRRCGVHGPEKRTLTIPTGGGVGAKFPFIVPPKIFARAWHGCNVSVVSQWLPWYQG